MYRGIENGRSVLREVSGGLSVATDYRGKMYDTLDFYAAGTKLMIANLPTGHVFTVYSVIGDVFAYGCLTGVGLGLVGMGKTSRKLTLKFVFWGVEKTVE